MATAGGVFSSVSPPSRHYRILFLGCSSGNPLRSVEAWFRSPACGNSCFKGPGLLSWISVAIGVFCSGCIVGTLRVCEMALSEDGSSKEGHSRHDALRCGRSRAWGRRC